MLTTITPDEMKALEARYMADSRVPGALLMEHAAQGVVAALTRRAPGGRALFLCGPGNNGGDGYAAARLWQSAGGRAEILEVNVPSTADAVMNSTLAMNAGVHVSEFTGELPEADVLVDALYGTGLSRPVRGDARDVIRMANASGKPIIAVDIPSGLHGLTGEILGEAIRATETVTFHRLKTGLLLRSGPSHAGKITVHPILIPSEYGGVGGLSVLTPDDLSLIHRRAADAHKGDMGRVVILAGSPGMAGAAAFAASAALKTGAGLVTLLCRESILPTLQALAPGATCRVLPADPAEAASLCAQALAGANAAVIGPGMGTDDALLPLAEAFRAANCPVVWDADALTLIARHGLLPLKATAVVTPHPGEAARLMDISTSSVLAQPLDALESLRRACGCTVLLKGARTLMADGSRTAANLYGTPAMAKGGSGDVLTGILAALLARRTGIDQLTLTQLAALIHGLAGIRAEAVHGENGVGPWELIGQIRLDAEGLRL